LGDHGEVAGLKLLELTRLPHAIRDHVERSAGVLGLSEGADDGRELVVFEAPVPPLHLRRHDFEDVFNVRDVNEVGKAPRDHHEVLVA